MKELSETEIIELFSKTIDDLSHGVGIFEVEDLNDIKSIRYVFMNKIVLYEMRKQREEVFGKKIHEVAPEAYEHEGGLYVIESYRKVAKEGGSINLGLVEYSNHMVAGIYECSVHHIQNNYIYVMLRNVTELEQTKNELELKKNELELKNEELSQFAYMASHDLKEPLRTISGFVQLIEKKYHEKFDDNARKLLNFISVATVRMRNLINDLLEYSNVGEEKEMVLVDCEKLVKVIQQDLGAIIKETNTTFDVGKLPHIKGYETQLRMLFQNLISNGIKFSKSEGAPKITISAEEQNGWTFSIQDEGIGIADVHSDKIFTAFKRLHSTSEYEGTGIGLAHCKKVVELHKGRIWVKSKEGEGSTFYFTIPNQ